MKWDTGTGAYPTVVPISAQDPPDANTHIPNARRREMRLAAGDACREVKSASAVSQHPAMKIKKENTGTVYEPLLLTR
jgi:hypothetical protein